MVPRRSGEPPDEALVKRATSQMKQSLDIVEGYFLKNNKFVAGDEISIADLLFVCELTQYWSGSINPCEGRPNMTRWIAECQGILNPHFDEVHKEIYETRDSKIYSAILDL